ncbi:Ubiquitin carboxyl-terminal hydrolase 32 [Armadillidium vulgare]|nr:Ubiquitin carboxyl-terminal hydrolase 32 [Armadillidium vulgare]
MGGKESKPISLTYEEALKRVTDAELSRIKDAFKRLGTLNVIFGVYSNEAGSHVVRSEMLKQLQRSEVHYVKESVLKLFANNEKVSYDDFREWLVNNPDATTITRWLLDENSTVSLSNELETPTFYQTLAGWKNQKYSNWKRGIGI